MFVLLCNGRAWKLRKISAGTQRAVRAGTETRPYKKAPCLPLRREVAKPQVLTEGENFIQSAGGTTTVTCPLSIFNC